MDIQISRKVAEAILVLLNIVLDVLVKNPREGEGKMIKVWARTIAFLPPFHDPIYVHDVTTDFADTLMDMWHDCCCVIWFVDEHPGSWMKPSSRPMTAYQQWGVDMFLKMSAPK